MRASIPQKGIMYFNVLLIEPDFIRIKGRTGRQLWGRDEDMMQSVFMTSKLLHIDFSVFYESL